MRGIASAAALALVMGLAVPTAQAGDTKPLKGKAYQTSRVYLNEVPDNSYLQEIVDELGPPSYVLGITSIHHNNVAGLCDDSSEEIGYYGTDEVTGRLVNRFYTRSVIVAANGDTLITIIAGVTQLEDDPYTFEYIGVIMGGTGRFEGAWGFFLGKGTGPFPYPSTYKGVVSTVGSTMRDQ